MTHFLSGSYSTDERRDEQPAVLQQGERRVPDHVLDVVIETVGACRVSQNGTKRARATWFILYSECLFSSVFGCVTGGQVMENGGGGRLGQSNKNEWQFKRRGRVNVEKHVPQLPLVLKVITAVTKVQYMPRLNANISWSRVSPARKALV